MSSYRKETKNPKTGEIENSYWIDDLFGPHQYGVVFPSDLGHEPDWATLELEEAKCNAYRAEEFKNQPN